MDAMAAARSVQALLQKVLAWRRRRLAERAVRPVSARIGVGAAVLFFFVAIGAAVAVP